MSDLLMYELEDIAWDEFDQINDHTVPQHGNEESEPPYPEDYLKKPGHDVIGISSNVGDCFSSGYVNQEREESIQPLKKKTTKLLERGSTTTLSSDSMKVPGQTPSSSNIDNMDAEFCGDDSISGDMSQIENNLSFLDNDPENNESTDLLYYGWPDIENFEDVDRILSHEDDLLWLSSSHNIEEPDGMLKSDYKVSYPELSPYNNVPEQDISRLNNASASADDSNICSSIRQKPGFQGSGISKADMIGNMTFMNGSVFLNKEGDFAPNEQKKQTRSPKISEGKRKDWHKQKKNKAPNSFGYMQNPTPYMHLNYTHPSDGLQPSGIKTNVSSLAYISPRESSGPLRTPPFMSVEEKLEKLRRRRALYSSSVSNQVTHFQNEVKICNRDNRAKVINPAEIYSSNVPQTSCMSSRLDETSLLASSFHQLQQAMEQLDLRTKLCIRDSLYRLARSAEQRTRYANMRGGAPINRETGDMYMAEGSNNGFMDIETDTNPIDRSVAHLLFHRPSDLSVMPARDGSPFKMLTTVHGSVTSPPATVEQLVFQDETTSEGGKKISITDDG